MSEVISVSPFKCRMWAGHERIEEHINEATCREEIESVRSHGQKIPVLARPLKLDPNHTYELIYGARRLFVARHLNVPLQVEVRETSDRDAIIALDIENRLRKDFSPYERARSYSAWLRGGLFSSQEELARAVNISPSQLSRLLKLAQLPTVLVAAFASPTDICETWGRDLIPIWEDPASRHALTECARAITQEGSKPGASAIYQRLVASTASKRKEAGGGRTDDHDEVVKDDGGQPLFRVRVHRKNVAILLPSMHLSKEMLLEIKDQVAIIMRRKKQHSRDSARTTRVSTASGHRRILDAVHPAR